MFGIGPQEMMMIALFGLIIFGPGKLPEVMREAGKHYRKFKGLADEMTGELNKVTAEARKELDGALGEFGPVGKDLEKSLGLGKTTSTRTTSTTSAAKTASTSSTAKKTTTTSKSTSAAKTTGSAKPVTDSRSTVAAATPGKPKQEIATKADPLADFMVFEGEQKESRRRSRSATPSAIKDLTPREEDLVTVGAAEKSVVVPPVDLSQIDDPMARARARRRGAGYARV